MVQPIAFAVVAEDRSKNPTVAVKVRELRGLQLRVELGTANFVQEFFVAPEAACGSAFRIADESLVALLFGGVALFLGIHLVAIDLVVPPGEAKVSVYHIRAGMDVTDHALARGDRSRESVFNRMPGLVFRDGGIGRSAEPRVAVLRVGSRMGWIGIIGIDNVARRAAAGAIVAGMVVRARERHHRIKQARFL